MAISISRPELLRQPPQGVVFDTDNTLYPYAPAHAKAMEASRKKACATMDLSPAQFDELFGQARASVQRLVPRTASAHSRLLYFQRFIELAGGRTELLLTLDLEQTYWRTFLTHCNVFAGVIELLDDLRAAGLPTAIVTDLTAQIQFRKIIYLGLEGRFDHVVTSEESGHDKPHRNSFERILEKMGLASGQVWMIGDSRDDIVGARAAIGAVTLQKRHEGVEVLTGSDQADVVFEQYSEVRKIFAEYNWSPAG